MIKSFVTNLLRQLRAIIIMKITHPTCVILAQIWTHHATKSGYVHIAKGVGKILYLNGQLLPRRFWKTLSPHNKPKDAEFRWMIWSQVIASGSNMLLVLDADFQGLKLWPKPSRYRGQIIGVFHQPSDILREIMQDQRIEIFDKAICVSHCQESILLNRFIRGHIRFIPHGVDIEFYHPINNEKEPMVLSVGAHRRDFDAIWHVAELLQRRTSGVRFILVGPRKNIRDKRILDTSLIEFKENISDFELRQLYRGCSVLLLPLTEATANNSLLEGMACGCTIVVSDVGGIRDYIDSTSGVLISAGDYETFGNAVLQLLEDTEMRLRIGNEARRKAEMFSWKIVREEFKRQLFAWRTIE